MLLFSWFVCGFCCWGCGIFIRFFFSLHFLLPHLCTLSWPDIKNCCKMKKLTAEMVSSLFMIPSARQLSRCVITSVFLYANLLGAVQIQTKKEKRKEETLDKQTICSCSTTDAWIPTDLCLVINEDLCFKLFLFSGL